MSHIEVYVLKSFPWSEDGYTHKHAEAHTTIHLPEKLFDGLNKEGFVRRAIIGDGHVELRPLSTDGGAGIVLPRSTTGDAPLLTAAPTSGAPAVPPVVSVVDASSVAQTVVGENTVTAAPQPPSKTAALTEDEEKALADGTWKDLRFFAQRSIAAKISDEAVTNGDEVKRVIEAEIVRRAKAEAL